MTEKHTAEHATGHAERATSYETAMKQAERCKTLQDLQEIVHNCAWMTSQQSLLLKTAILAFYNDGSLPPASAGNIPAAEKELKAREQEWEARMTAGDATRTADDIVAEELRQALRLNQVHLHTQLRLVEQLGRMYEEVVGLLTERIKTLPRFSPPAPDQD